MFGFAFITKRKLTKAIALAKQDGKFSGLNPVDAQTALWGRQAVLFWRAGYIADIRTRDDGTIFIGYVRDCNPQLDVTIHTI